MTFSRYSQVFSKNIVSIIVFNDLIGNLGHFCQIEYRLKVIFLENKGNPIWRWLVWVFNCLLFGYGRKCRFVFGRSFFCHWWFLRKAVNPMHLHPRSPRYFFSYIYKNTFIFTVTTLSEGQTKDKRDKRLMKLLNKVINLSLLSSLFSSISWWWCIRVEWRFTGKVVCHL